MSIGLLNDILSDLFVPKQKSDSDHTLPQTVLIHEISNGIEEDSVEIVQLPPCQTQDLFKPFVSTYNFKKYCSKLNVKVEDIVIDWSLGDSSLCEIDSSCLIPK